MATNSRVLGEEDAHPDPFYSAKMINVASHALLAQVVHDLDPGWALKILIAKYEKQ